MPAVSEESTLLLLILLLPFGHLVELVLGLPKDIMEIGIREVVLQREERARRGQLWLLRKPTGTKGCSGFEGLACSGWNLVPANHTEARTINGAFGRFCWPKFWVVS